MKALRTAAMYLKRGPKALDEPTDVFTGSLTLLDGSELDLSTLHGKPALIVNTASKCGFTPQYDGLQRLHEEYGPKGLNVIGCASGDFAGQELDSSEAIGEFCRKNHGVTFPVSEKVSVRADPHPLWDALARQPGSAAPTWNFCKYLVDADGKFVARWNSKTDPQDSELTARIDQVLAQG